MVEKKAIWKTKKQVVRLKIGDSDKEEMQEFEWPQLVCE